jgi:2-polyprenyl-3-methyl-5-hydroxy-6-metoxy-1,4-benzoquinol methylase
MNGEVLKFIKKTPITSGQRVLEVGSLWVNGSPREVVSDVEYIGIDFREGKGVDITMRGEDVADKWPEGHFDVVLCCETLEHCEDWKAVLSAWWKVLKTGGYACVTTPNSQKGRHNHPWDYWRWTLEDYAKIFSGQKVLKSEQVYSRGVGVIVQKLTDTLDLNVKPGQVI